MANEVAFCERSVKHWVSALVLFGALVLGFALWSAIEEGPKKRENKGHGQTAAFMSPISPVAYVQPAPMNNGSRINTANAAINRQQIDAVTRATPMGGIQFIGGVAPGTAQSTNFNWAADVIRPSVVNVNAVRPNPVGQRIANPQDPRFVDPFDGVPDKMIGQMAYESVGSGVIVDKAGYVVTNNHVVAGATSVVITRFNNSEEHFPARVVAFDTSKDLALLKIQGGGPFPEATISNSSKVEVGDWVLAVGNPFGLEHTVTAGIISGKRSSLTIGGVNYRGLLQTDAPINKGSSGGPLVNLRGEVIGINTAIYAPTGVFNGTGFAIPSNRVGGFVARSLDRGQRIAVVAKRTAVIDAAWLGIGVIDMTPDLAAKLSYPHSGGVYVSSLVLDSPADEAEIVRGDIVTAVAGRPIQGKNDLRKLIAGLSPRQTVPITIWRNSKTVNLKLRTNAGTPAGM
ncbi:MAG: PDZ domain-containing protein [Deltaproteobacteria bacterium]|nr:PDZ domain-containing protein [Deltaproteobacteria bacterium]